MTKAKDQVRFNWNGIDFNFNRIRILSHYKSVFIWFDNICILNSSYMGSIVLLLNSLANIFILEEGKLN
jgi:hypothetical protein